MSADVVISGVSGDRLGDSFCGWDGRRIWPADPRIGDLTPICIANALARINRFGGHLAVDGYSVAQHSVLVSRHCDPQNALVGLLHDAHEAVLGDWISPLKRSLPAAALEALKALERRWQFAIACTFGLGAELVDLPSDVKRADVRALWTESRDLRAATCALSPNENAAAPFDEPIIPWSVGRAVHEWMARFHELHDGIERGAEAVLASGGAP